MDQVVQDKFMAGVKKFDVDGARQSALMVFWEQGYNNTSLDDLTEAMNISRSSFYNSFQSKHSLFLEVIDLYQNIVVTELSKELTAKDAIKETVLRIMDKVLGVTGAAKKEGTKGCLLGNTALELGLTDQEAALRTRAGLDALNGIFETVLKRGLSSGELSRKRSPTEWAGFLTASVQGALVLGKSGALPETVREVIEIAVESIY